MSPMANCRDGDVVHLAFCCIEVKCITFQRFQKCRTMLSMVLLCRLSDVFLSYVQLGIAVNGLPMRNFPGVKASASLTSVDGVTNGLELRMASICMRTVRNG